MRRQRGRARKVNRATCVDFFPDKCCNFSLLGAADINGFIEDAGQIVDNSGTSEGQTTTDTAAFNLLIDTYLIRSLAPCPSRVCYLCCSAETTWHSRPADARPCRAGEPT